MNLGSCKIYIILLLEKFGQEVLNCTLLVLKSFFQELVPFQQAREDTDYHGAVGWNSGLPVQVQNHEIWKEYDKTLRKMKLHTLTSVQNAEVLIKSFATGQETEPQWEIINSNHTGMHCLFSQAMEQEPQSLRTKMHQ